MQIIGIPADDPSARAFRSIYSVNADHLQKFLLFGFPEQMGSFFGSMLANPSVNVVWMLITIAIGFLVCAGGLRNSIFMKMNRHNKPHKWRRLSSRVVFTHPRMILAEDEVELPDGKRSLYLRQVYQGKGGIIIIAL